VSNCGEVELLVNGGPVRTLSGAILYGVEVPYAEGLLCARGGRNGESVEDILASYGPAVGVALEARDAAVGPGGVGDVLLRVVDDVGTTVVGWHGDVEIVVDGPLRLRAHREDGTVPVRGGLGRAFVQAPKDRSGEATVEAVAEDLAVGRVHIQVSPGREAVGSPESGR